MESDYQNGAELQPDRLLVDAPDDGVHWCVFISRFPCSAPGKGVGSLDIGSKRTTCEDMIHPKLRRQPAVCSGKISIRFCDHEESLRGGTDVPEWIAGQQEQAIAVTLFLNKGFHIPLVNDADGTALIGARFTSAQLHADGIAFPDLFQAPEMRIAVSHHERCVADRFAAGKAGQIACTSSVKHQQIHPYSGKLKPCIRFAECPRGRPHLASAPYPGRRPRIPRALDPLPSGPGHNGQTQNQHQ